MRWMPFILIVTACDPTTAKKAAEGEVDIGDTAAESVAFEDRDRDGHLAGEDCDDTDYQVYPGAEEICDGKDNDCNGEVDEGFDLDGDGAWNMAACAHGNDCDDTDPEVPKGERPYDGIDQDCDGEDLTDVDRDGFDGRSGGGNDCDDFDDTVHPGAAEIALDDIDQDCDGLDLLDGDGDGFESADFGGDDCDDEDKTIYPGAMDWVGDGVDHDCDGVDGGLFDSANANVVISGTPGEFELVGHDVIICDVDGDEKQDIVVTAPYAGEFQGAVSVFYGRNSDSWTDDMRMDQAGTYILSTGTGWGFGAACADVNADGLADLIIGQGEIQFGPYVSDYAVNIIYGVGGMLPGLLDDRDADAVLTMDLGAPGGVAEVQGGILTATDLTGDGAAEIILDQNVGNTAYGESAVWVIAGSDYFGEYALDDLSYAEIADPQGDTVTSMAVDGQHYFVGQGGYRPGMPSDAATPDLYPAGGKVAVLGLLAGEYGSISDAADLEISLDVEANLGASIAVGDYDSDGLMDLALGAPAVDGVGAIYLMSEYERYVDGGGESTLSLPALDIASSFDQRIVGTSGGLGVGVTMGGDMTGDGVPDLLVAESEADGVGVVWLVSGALLVDGDNPAEDVSVLGIRAQYHAERIGQTLGSADFDGDGVEDVVIGSSHHPTPADVGLAMSGRVSILLSSGL